MFLSVFNWERREGLLFNKIPLSNYSSDIVVIFCRIVTGTVTICVIQYDGLYNNVINNGESDVFDWARIL